MDGATEPSPKPDFPNTGNENCDDKCGGKNIDVGVSTGLNGVLKQINLILYNNFILQFFI